MNINLKKVISSVAALAMSLSCFTAFAADFSDVEATASYKNAIDELVALEIVNGYEDGTFKPDNEITRAEVTKMVVAAMGPSYTQAAESSVGGSGFADVDAAGHWASGFIAVGVAQEFINGMGDGTFAPDANVTYAQIVKMLVAALGYTTAAEYNGGYPNGYLQMGNSTGITAGISGVSQDTPVTRAQVAQLISNAIDTPLVLVTGWETNYITGEPVAKTEVMDGEDGRSYKTLLTENHDVYKVKGRVEATHAQGTTKVGEVDFRVENADNYDGHAYKAYVQMEDLDGAGPNPAVPVIYNSAYISGAAVGETAANDLLFTYAEALIALDADDEATILTIKPYGKNDIFTLAAKDFAAYTAGTPNTVDFYVNETSSKTKTYKLDAAVQLYVNGINVGAGVNAGTMATYATANKIGTVTLIDSPATGETSKDGDIDYVMIDVQKWAVVDTTMETSEDLIIYLKDFETGAVGASIKIDTTDEDLVYEFTKNGEEADFADIKTDDVLLVKYDVVGNLASANASNFITIDICDKVVEGQVVGSKVVDGAYVYTVDGAEYKYWTGANVLTTTTEYKLFVDSFDRIIRYEELASSANYAVIDRVYKDNNTDEYKVRLIKADGTRETYVAKSIDIAAAAGNVAYASGGTTISGNYDLNGDGTPEAITGRINGTLNTLDTRAIKYKTNSSKEINSITPLALSTATAEYSESSTRVNAARMDEATQILDLTDVVSKGADDAALYTAADIAAGSLASFVDGEDYTVLFGDRNASSGTYRFVIITVGNADITALTSFAVIDSVSQGTNADGAVTVLNVYTADEQGLVSYEVDEDVVVPALNEGDVVVMFVDNGIVKSFAGVIYSEVAVYGGLDMFNTSLNPLAYNPTDTTPQNPVTPGDDRTLFSNYFIATGISKWEDTTVTSNNWARAGYGIVVDKVGSTITVARKSTAAGTEATGVTAGDTISAGTDVEEFNVASDVNVFVYDYNAQAGKRVSKGAFGNVVRTVVPEAAIFTAADGSDVYDWTVAAGINAISEYAVYYKVTNDEITDIFVIAPVI